MQAPAMRHKYAIRSAVLACLAAAPLGRANAQSETVLYSFAGGSDGAEPRGALIADKAGNLYGTTFRGGAANRCAGVGCGVVFEMSPPAAGQTQWTETVLYAFTGVGDGANPVAGLLMDSAGRLYGSTQRGGGNQCGGFGCGTIFVLNPPLSGQTQWTKTELYGFTGSDGAAPLCDLVFDAAGNLLGTTSQGGNANAGTVFRLNAPPPNSTTWSEQVLYNFTGLLDGGNPGAGVIVDASGNIYGSTVNGGAGLSGVAFQLAPPAGQGGAWTENILYNFPGGAYGGYPRSPLKMDSSGDLYGTATNIAFELTPPAAGGAWGEAILHSFQTFADGNIPFAGLTIVDYGATTAYYGTAGFGGTSRVGVVYKLVAPNATNSGWTESLLYRFSGAGDGGNPFGGLLFAPGGVLYGTTTFGGTLTKCDVGCGTVFALSLH